MDWEVMYKKYCFLVKMAENLRGVINQRSKAIVTYGKHADNAETSAAHEANTLSKGRLEYSATRCRENITELCESLDENRSELAKIEEKIAKLETELYNGV